MVFSSVEFLLFFLPIFLIIYGITPKSYKNVTLVTGSLVFYAYGDLRYLPFLMVSIVVNFLISRRLQGRKKESRIHKKKRTTKLIIAIIGNVGALTLFKVWSDKLGLPLGISFYTFQILSYLIDVYRGEIRCARSFMSWMSYITMFPKLISGPIMNYGNYSMQLKNVHLTAEKIQDGLKTFTIGLAAKVLLADRIGLLWREVQVTGYESITVPLAWIGAIAYSMKIYYDFYGYSLMAIGVGRMLGFDLPDNFHHPYMARSVRHFYRRWHMTLGKWFSKYVYVPLGGSRLGELRTIFNLLIVWILTSVWHGGTVNFLIWGLALWLLIVIERQVEKISFVKKLRVLPRLYLWFVIPITWMFFAITDLSQLQIYLSRMFAVTEGINVNFSDWQKALGNYGGLLVIAMVCCTPYIKKGYEKIKNHLLGQLALGGLFWFCVWRIIEEGKNTFMYFRF